MNNESFGPQKSQSIKDHHERCSRVCRNRGPQRGVAGKCQTLKEDLDPQCEGHVLADDGEASPTMSNQPCDAG